MTTLAMGIGLGGLLAGGAGILDAHLPAVVGAFGLRRLVSAWSGPLITVRRASDNATMALYPAADGWIDGAALLAWAGASSVHVTRWHNQSGTAQHLEQATASAQPQIVISGTLVTLGGRPALQSGSGMYLAAAITERALPISLVALFSLTATSDTIVRRLACSYSSAPPPEWSIKTDGKLLVSHGVQITAPSALAAATATVMTTIADSSACDVRVNGVSVLNAAAGTLGLGPNLMLFGYPGLDRPLNGKAGEIIFLARKLQSYDAALLEAKIGAPRGVAIP